ncbi:MAG: hypothetical protein E7174_03110 [Firmicutes bacterium]|nr:hypothetical protein [Bacillota bacterium]
MKELPKVFHNRIDKKFDNNRNVYYSNNTYDEERSVDTRTVLQKINDIFSSPNYVYKANVEITLKDKKVTKRIIGRNKNYIITMDNDLIPITDIVDIKSTKK